MDIADKIEKGKIRGILTVRNRNKFVYPEAIYHITQRAPGKELLFLEDADYLYMLSLIKEIQSFFKWDIFSFVLIPNHLHLLLQIKEANLSKGAKRLFEKYAKYFNSKYKRKGSVFCRPYRASLCLDNSYLLAASLYIHLNPSKAGFVKKATEYRWSSILLYVNKKKNPRSFVNYRFILEILSEDLNKAKDIYTDLMEEAEGVEYKNILEEPNFMRKFRDLILKIANPQAKKSLLGVENWSLDKDVIEFRRRKGARKPESKKAKKYLIEQLLADGYKITEVASLLGVTRQCIYKILS